MTGVAIRRRRPPEAPPSEFADLVGICAGVEARRFVLVSNDPRLTPAALRTLRLAHDDVLVQFNAAVHRPHLSDVDCHRWHLFNRHAGGNWGYPVCAEEALGLAASPDRCLQLFLEGMEAAIERSAAQSSPAIRRFAFYPADDLAACVYPAGCKMSAGFATICLLSMANQIRRQQGREAPALVVVGFTGEAVENGRVVQGWGVHDFAFEVSALNGRSDVLRVGFDALASA